MRDVEAAHVVVKSRLWVHKELMNKEHYLHANCYVNLATKMVSISIYRMRIGLNYNKNGPNKQSKIKTKIVKQKSNMGIFKLLFKLALIILTISSIQGVLQATANKTNHIKYGNKNGGTLKFMHWNKGPSNIKIKTEHLRILIDKYKPNVILLSEASYNIGEADTTHNFFKL